ncbi:Scr1 family TA system antitoxin-like transcriptional regulator [Streptomyces sp. NPDC001880]
MQFAGPRVARAQLDHIAERSERVRVIPFAAGGFPGAGQSSTTRAGPASAPPRTPPPMSAIPWRHCGR